MFRLLTTETLIAYSSAFKWNKTPLKLHIHHTYLPDFASWQKRPDGLYWQNSMRDYHVKVRGFRDIAQHLTLLPAGNWITGRDFNMSPASFLGHNDRAFAIEMLGNFDKGHDKFQGKQAAAMYKFAAWFIKHFNLSTNDIIFHRESKGAYKTCPGTSINKKDFIAGVIAYQTAATFPDL